jgi:hypothetical protein
MKDASDVAVHGQPVAAITPTALGPPVEGSEAEVDRKVYEQIAPF